MAGVREIVQCILRSISVIHEEATKLREHHAELQDLVSRVEMLVTPALLEMLKPGRFPPPNGSVSSLFPFHTAIECLKALVVTRARSQSEPSSCLELIKMETSKVKAEVGAVRTTLLRSFELICDPNLNRTAYVDSGLYPALMNLHSGSDIELHDNVPWFLDPKDLTTGQPSEQNRVCGGGWTSTVGLLKGKKTVTVRITRCDSNKAERIKDVFFQHAALHYRMLHPNLVTLVGILVDHEDTSLEPSFTFVTEPCFHETLLEYMKRGCLTDIKSKQELVKGMMQGLACLHSLGLCHGRINPSNVLVDSTGNPQYTLFEHLTTFHINALQPSKPSDWLSPEQTNENSDSVFKQPLPASDLYSFGLVAALVLTGCTELEKRKPATLPELVHDLYGNGGCNWVIRLCTIPHPFQRPSTDAVACLLHVGIIMHHSKLLPASISELYKRVHTDEASSASNSCTDSVAEESKWILICMLQEAILKKNYVGVLSMIKDKPDDPTLLCAACHALSVMTRNKDPIVEQGIRRHKGIDILLSSMERCKDSLQVQVAGYQTISDLAFDIDETAKQFVDLRIIEKVLIPMRTFASHSEMQLVGTTTLLSSCFCWESQAIHKLLKAGGLEVIVSAIARHNDKSHLLVNGIQLLSLLEQVNHRCIERIIQAGGGEALIAVLPKLKTLPDYHLIALRILFSIAHVSSECIDKFEWSQCGEDLLSFMELHGVNEPPETLEWLIRMMLLMLENSKEPQRAQKIAARGIQVVLTIMRQHHSNCSIQREGCMALFKFLYTTDQEHAKKVAKQGGLESIMSALRQNFEDVSLNLHGCAAFGMCLEQNLPELMRSIEGEYVEILLSTMDKFNDCESVLEWCCRALSTIAVHTPGGIHHLTVTMKEIDAVRSSTMKHYGIHFQNQQGSIVPNAAQSAGFMDKTNVSTAVPEKSVMDYLEHQETDLQMLRYLASIDGEHVCTGCTSVLEKIIELMSEKGKSIFIQVEGCNLISMIAAGGQDCRKRIAKTEAVEVVLSCMRENSENQRIQEVGITTLSAISSENDILLHRMVDQGGIEWVVAVMQSYPHVIQLQELCCDLASNLPCNKESAERMAEANMCEVVITTMRLHSLNQKIQFQGCKALFRCISSGGNVVNKIATAGGIDALVSAAINHHRDDSIWITSFKALAELGMQGQEFLQKIYNSLGLTKVPAEEMDSFQLTKFIKLRLQKKISKKEKDCEHQQADPVFTLRRMQTSHNRNSQSNSHGKEESDKFTDHHQVKSELTDERIEEILKNLEPEGEQTLRAKTTGNSKRKQRKGAKQSSNSRQPANGKNSNGTSDVQAEQVEVFEEKAEAFDKCSKEEEDRNWCVICLEAESTHAYIPCGHLAVCQECKDKSPSHCPICNQKSIMCTRIFRPM